MAKRVIVIVLLLVVALFAYVGYRGYDAKRLATNGEVYSNGVIRRSRTEPREQPDPREQSDDPDTVVYPTPGTTAASPATGDANPAPAPAASSTQQVTQSQQPAANVPATDTINPNPPNGMTFAGSGRYQLYRQGNLTWRLDTDSGRTCIIFATDEEWKKPRVYRAGCSGN